MINRVLIRSKVLQMVYAFYQKENTNLRDMEKEFIESLEKSYELYHYLLLLMNDITYYAEKRIDQKRNKYLPTEEDINPNTRFIDNRFVAQLRENHALDHYVSAHKLSWEHHEQLIKTLFEQISTSPAYIEYMQADSCDYEADKEVWRKIFKQTLNNGSDLAEALEEDCIYWNDDLDIVITFVIKTIKRFEEAKGADQELLPMFKDNDDKLFALKLFRAAIQNGEEYRQMITSSVKNWELERLAMMDLIILQIALAEILEVEEIPLNVSFNEYIDLAKVFSTEKSGTFINGTLDHLVQQLKKDNKLFKN
ncbi:MAG: transcription antitermination factor NusB [Bacteroidales bacterium]|nr:transcription antitermination factor NusB [Bacteroidales bacterium]